MYNEYLYIDQGTLNINIISYASESSQNSESSVFTKMLRQARAFIVDICAVLQEQSNISASKVVESCY